MDMSVLLFLLSGPALVTDQRSGVGRSLLRASEPAPPVTMPMTRRTRSGIFPFTVLDHIGMRGDFRIFGQLPKNHGLAFRSHLPYACNRLILTALDPVHWHALGLGVGISEPGADSV